MSSNLPPQPRPDSDTQAFWEATTEGQLALCRCVDCRMWLHPPLERCRRCAGKTVFESVSGTGTVYSFIVQRAPAVVGYVDEVPYVVALVELDGVSGVRLPARIVECDPDSMTIGMRVEVEFVDLPGDEFKVAVFRPAPTPRDA